MDKNFAYLTYDLIQCKCGEWVERSLAAIKSLKAQNKKPTCNLCKAERNRNYARIHKKCYNYE